MLPETGVTLHSGHIGYTFGPLQGDARGHGRSVIRWMSGSNPLRELSNEVEDRIAAAAVNSPGKMTLVAGQVNRSET